MPRPHAARLRSWRKVPLRGNSGPTFASRLPTAVPLIGEFQSETTITCILDRTLLPKRALGANQRRHLNPRRRRLCVVRARRRPMTRWAGIDRTGVLVPRKIVDRQCPEVGHRRPAGNRTDQVHAPGRRCLHVFIAVVERIGQEFLGSLSPSFNWSSIGTTPAPSGSHALCGSAAVISCTSLAGTQVSASWTW